METMSRSEINGPVRRSQAVYLPEHVWGRLASTAEDRGVSIEDLLVTAITELLSPMTVAEHVAQLARAGMPDALIAARTGLLLQRVAQLRRRAHVPANRFYRGEGRVERKAS